MDKIKINSNIKSIERAHDILVALSQGVERISDLSRKTKLSISTVHRFLKTLEECGFVSQDPVANSYHLGHLIVKLASDPRAGHLKLCSCAIDRMEHLYKISEETVNLNILIGKQRILLHEIPSKHTLKCTEAEKLVMPLYASSASKVLLSQLKDSELDVVLRIIELTPARRNAISYMKNLKNDLRQIREQGYAISDGEIAEGAMGISVPIRNYLYPVTLSIIGPKNRLKPLIELLIREMKEIAEQISQNIFQDGQITPKK